MEGWVYVCITPAKPGHIKLGYTTRTVDQRLLEIKKEYDDVLMNWAVAYKMEEADAVERVLHGALKNRGRHRYAEVHECGVHEVVDMLEQGIKDERINWKVIERRQQIWYSKRLEERARAYLKKAKFMRGIGFEASGSSDSLMILLDGVELTRLSFIADGLLFYIMPDDLGLASMYDRLGIGG